MLSNAFRLRSQSKLFYTLVRTHATATSPASTLPSNITTRWSKGDIQEIYDSPLLDLVYRAASVHRIHHDPSKIQLCTLMNIKSMWIIV